MRKKIGDISGRTFIVKNLDAMYDMLIDEEYEYTFNEFQELLLAELIDIAKMDVKDSKADGMYVYPGSTPPFFERRRLLALLTEECTEIAEEYQGDPELPPYDIKEEVQKHYKAITDITHMDADNYGYSLLWWDTDYKLFYRYDFDGFLKLLDSEIGKQLGMGTADNILNYKPLSKTKITEENHE